MPSDHPDKQLEHGSEPTPAAFLATLLDVTEAVGRVLAPHGSIAVELGDTYSATSSDGVMKGYEGDRKQLGRDISQVVSVGRRMPGGRGWPLPKSLCMVPGLYAASLAYGRNLLALPGDPEWREFAPWRVRNLIAWARPNPPVGALGDKWRPATSYITVATRSATRWWDDIATRHPAKPYTDRPMQNRERRQAARGDSYGAFDYAIASNPAGAPLLDWWNITPTGYTSRLGAHYATWPDQLVTPLVQAMCPRRVCRTCGTPSRRIVGEAEYVPSATNRGGSAWADAERVADGVNQWVGPKGGRASVVRQAPTVGWTTCGCPCADGVRDDGYHDGPAWRPGVVCDPYCGTGTTLVVATGHGRDAVGIDLNPANAALAEERLGMFLDVETHTPEAAA